MEANMTCGVEHDRGSPTTSAVEDGHGDVIALVHGGGLAIEVAGVLGPHGLECLGCVEHIRRDHGQHLFERRHEEAVVAPGVQGVNPPDFSQAVGTFGDLRRPCECRALQVLGDLDVAQLSVPPDDWTNGREHVAHHLVSERSLPVEEILESCAVDVGYLRSHVCHFLLFSPSCMGLPRWRDTRRGYGSLVKLNHNPFSCILHVKKLFWSHLNKR